MVENYKNKTTYKNYAITFIQIKRIHTLKNILGLDDELYREMLASFDVQTSKNLTTTEAQILIDILQDKVKQASNFKQRYEDLTERDDMASPAQLRKIEAIWKDITHITDRSIFQKTLRKFLSNKFKTSDTRFITKKQAIKVIAVLGKIREQNLNRA